MPLLWDRERDFRERLEGRTPVVFLDYDGTLTPIVDRPDDALLPVETRDVIERLKERLPVAVVSGRDLADVRGLVGVDGIAYAGSHGFDIRNVDGSGRQRGQEFLPDLDAAERDLRLLMDGIDSAFVERKAFAVTAHFRLVEAVRVPEVEAAVAEVAARHPRLRRTGGKKVFELRPAVEWDKGKALLWLLDLLGVAGPDHVPVYAGDDETDEDAFRAIQDRGLGVVVRGEEDDRPTAAQYALRDPGEARGFLELLWSIAGNHRP